MSLMYEVIQMVSEDAKKYGLEKVTKVELVVGELSNVLPDALELAFTYFQQLGGYPIDNNTRLHIIHENAIARCQTCQLEFKPDYRIALCPKCELPNSILISGETFRVESYEGNE